MEAVYGSVSPMWAGAPSPAFALQPPMTVGNGPLVASLFGASPLAGIASALPAAAQPNQGPAAPPANTYGYGAGLFAIGPQGPAALTASSLLTAVALRRGQPQGPANDQEVEEFIYDALELLPGATDVDVKCEGGRVVLSGSVPHKRVKHDVGEIAWAIPALNDIQNNVTIASRRRARTSGRDAETSASAPARKQG
jgi:hypothetical protein